MNPFEKVSDRREFGGQLTMKNLTNSCRCSWITDSEKRE